MNENNVVDLADERAMGYAEYGAAGGEPVFALHGTPGSRFMFRLAHARAGELGLRLIAPERPGYGLSTPQRPRSLTGWARDIGELADRLGLGRFAVVGISGGGPYAAACAARLGERITRAGLVSPIGPIAHPEVAAHLSRGHRRLFIETARSNWRNHLLFDTIRWSVHNVPTLALRTVIQLCPPSDRAILSEPHVATNLVESIDEGLRRGVRGGVQDLRLFSTPWDFVPEEIAVPCRIWQGDADTTVPPFAAEALAGLIPGSAYTRLPGAGHYWVFDNFTEVLDWVAEPEVERAIP